MYVDNTTTNALEIKVPKIIYKNEREKSHLSNFYSLIKKLTMRQTTFRGI